MRFSFFLLLPLVAACGKGDGDGGNPAAPKSAERVQTAELTGLYETGRDADRDGRMCMTAGSTGAAAFAIVTETPSGGKCGGAGEAAREGDRLRLTMAGEGECVIDARIAGTLVTFPASVAQGCAYYCGAGASLAGARLEKVGGTAEDAARATDLAGDPLCG